MIINNENKKLSRNRKRRIITRLNMSNDMKVLINKIKSEKRKRNKNLAKIKELETLLVNIKYANNPNKLNDALKELNKIQVFNKNLHEIKHEILIDYEGVFELVGNLKIGDQIRQTHIRLRNMDNFEAYINSIDQDYDSNDSIFNVIFIKSILLNLIK